LQTLVGTVDKAPEASFCMDGATHVLISSNKAGTAPMRLKPNTAAIKKQLDGLIGANVTVAGRDARGPECKRFEVSAIVKTNEPVKPN